MIPFLYIFSEPSDYPGRDLYPLILSLVFFLMITLGMILLIVILRIQKVHRHSINKNILERFHCIFNSALSRIEENQNRLNSYSAEKLISVHNLENKFSIRERQYILEEIINYSRNLKGSYKEILIAFYDKLKLQELSDRKLHSKKPRMIVKGLRELSEMNVSISWNDVIRLIYKNNPSINQELFYKLGSQSPEKLLSIIEQRHYSLTTWDEINIHAAYKRIDRNKLPRFNQWFFSPNPRLAIFCIKMTCEFQQESSYLDLPIVLDKSADPHKISMAVSAIAKMGTHEICKDLTKALYKWIDNQEIVYEILSMLKNLMDPEEFSIQLRKLSWDPSLHKYEILFNHHVPDTGHGEDVKIPGKEMLEAIKHAS
jgi:hypothetical protein